MQEGRCPLNPKHLGFRAAPQAEPASSTDPAVGRHTFFLESGTLLTVLRFTTFSALYNTKVFLLKDRGPDARLLVALVVQHDRRAVLALAARQRAVDDACRVGARVGRFLGALVGLEHARG